MKKLTIVLVFCLSGHFIFSQIIENLSIGLESNSAWYNDDKQKGSFFDDVNQDGDEHVRINNYLKLDYKFFKNFTASVQIESYEPFALLNYSPNFKGTNLGTFYLNYKNSKLDITTGHFYEQFGSGLILRSWEDRQLGINNALFGGKIEYRPSNFLSFTALYGKHREGFGLSDGTIYGFNTDFDLSNLLKFENSSIGLGFSYVGREENIELQEPKFDKLTNTFSGRLDFSRNNFYSSIEYVAKGDDAVSQLGQISNEFIKPGNAILFNIGFTKPGFGLNATFRRLENMSFFSERKTAGNVYFENIINYTPGLTKQHDYLLTNIFVYQAKSAISFLDPQLIQAGEIGGQIDLYHKIKKGTVLGGKYGAKIAFNASYWAGLKGDFDFANLEYEVDALGFGTKYFSDISLEVRKKWNKKWSSIFYYTNQYYNKKEIEGNFGAKPIQTNIIVFESTYKIGNGKSFRFETQKLFSVSEDHDWIGGTIEYNFNSKFSIFANDIYNNGKDNNTEKTHFYNFGGSYSKGSTRLGLNYGRQRAGLVCVGGVCRFVPEATGLTINLTTSF
jgi:hypothetical protein